MSLPLCSAGEWRCTPRRSRHLKRSAGATREVWRVATTENMMIGTCVMREINRVYVDVHRTTVSVRGRVEERGMWLKGRSRLIRSGRSAHRWQRGAVKHSASHQQNRTASTRVPTVDFADARGLNDRSA